MKTKLFFVLIAGFALSLLSCSSDSIEEPKVDETTADTYATGIESEQEQDAETTYYFAPQYGGDVKIIKKYYDYDYVGEEETELRRTFEIESFLDGVYFMDAWLLSPDPLEDGEYYPEYKVEINGLLSEYTFKHQTTYGWHLEPLTDANNSAATVVLSKGRNLVSIIVKGPGMAPMTDFITLSLFVDPNKYPDGKPDRSELGIPDEKSPTIPPIPTPFPSLELVFTVDDIKSYNITCGEIVFTNIIKNKLTMPYDEAKGIYKYFSLYHNDKQLFEGRVTRPWDNMWGDCIALYIGTGVSRCDFSFNRNTIAYEAEWEAFIKYLTDAGKIVESCNCDPVDTPNDDDTIVGYHPQDTLYIPDPKEP